MEPAGEIAKDSRTRLDVSLENSSQLFYELNLMVYRGNTHARIHCRPPSTSCSTVNSKGPTKDLVWLPKPKTEFVHSHELFIRLRAFLPHIRPISLGKAGRRKLSSRSRQKLNAISYSSAQTPRHVSQILRWRCVIARYPIPVPPILIKRAQEISK